MVQGANPGRTKSEVMPKRPTRISSRRPLTRHRWDATQDKDPLVPPSKSPNVFKAPSSSLVQPRHPSRVFREVANSARERVGMREPTESVRGSASVVNSLKGSGQPMGVAEEVIGAVSIAHAGAKTPPHSKCLGVPTPYTKLVWGGGFAHFWHQF